MCFLLSGDEVLRVHCVRLSLFAFMRSPPSAFFSQNREMDSVDDDDDDGALDWDDVALSDDDDALSDDDDAMSDDADELRHLSPVARDAFALLNEAVAAATADRSGDSTPVVVVLL